ncbi:ABC transporter permease [Dongia sp.]|uniref:ABC transporter permease n=1 Tax=Dongia sp. TaxID=1977262 RepID=UPI0037501194
MTALLNRDTLRRALPAITLAVLLAAIFVKQPMAMTSFGLTLILQYAVPIALATLAQMFVIAVNDLDLSIGSFVGLTTCISALYLATDPLLGIVLLLLCIAGYVAMGALIHLRNLPSIVVTLGMSFVWLGFAVLLLPSPGGKAPAWLTGLMNFKVPPIPVHIPFTDINQLVIPFPIIAATVIAIVVQLGLMHSSYGVVLRGTGGNPKAVARAGWSLLKTKLAMYGLAGTFGVLAGLSLIGLTSAGDARIADRYTLYSIAGVILGGGEFIGGKVSPVGAVLGAITLALAASFLIFLKISPDWQIGAQGAILIIVLALRAVITRGAAR